MLGRVESKQPVQGIPIASTILSRSPLCWSQDNNLVLATQLGACIFELHMSPHGDQAGLLFDRNHVPPPETSNPFITTGVPLQNLLRSLSSDEAQQIILDATLSAAHRASVEIANRKSHPQGTVTGPGGDSSHVGYSKGSWSPRAAAHGDGCLLCLVTYDHQVNLVAQIGIKWLPVFDLTSTWHQYSVVGKGKAILARYRATIGTKKHHHFIAQTKFLAVSEITWTEIFTDSSKDSFCVLLMATASSHLAVIKIPFLRKDKFEPSVFDCLELEDSGGKISALHWFSLKEGRGFVSVGTVKGNVDIYFVSVKENCTFIQHLIKLENSVQGMRVNHVEMTCVEEESGHCSYIAYVARHNLLFAHLLSATASTAQVLASTHSPLGCYAISGLQLIDPTFVYACVKDGKIVKMEVEFDLASNSISFRGRETLFSSDGVLYNGFCFSPNKAFLAILECVSVPYDHLLMREPSVVSFFQVNTLDTVLNHIFTSPPRSLAEQVDVFESLRLLSYREEKAPFPFLAPKGVNSLSSHLKRVYLWTTIIELGSVPREERGQVRQEKEELRTALEESILADYILKVFDSFAEEGLPSHPSHRLSLHLMTTFLQRTKVNHLVVKTIKAQLKKENAKTDESCLVCGNSVEFNLLKTAKCSKGHSMPRCWRSLVATIPIMKCIHCQLFYHPDAASLVFKAHEESATRCLICSRKLASKTKARRRPPTITPNS